MDEKKQLPLYHINFNDNKAFMLSFARENSKYGQIYDLPCEMCVNQCIIQRSPLHLQGQLLPIFVHHSYQHISPSNLEKTNQNVDTSETLAMKKAADIHRQYQILPERKACFLIFGTIPNQCPLQLSHLPTEVHFLPLWNCK